MILKINLVAIFQVNIEVVRSEIRISSFGFGMVNKRLGFKWSRLYSKYDNFCCSRHPVTSSDFKCFQSLNGWISDPPLYLVPPRIQMFLGFESFFKCHGRSNFVLEDFKLRMKLLPKPLSETGLRIQKRQLVGF